MQIIPRQPSVAQPKFGILSQVLGQYREERAYLVWRAFAQDGSDKFSKLPVDPATGAATAPNTAKIRGVLTFSEAMEAVQDLRGMDLPVGLGVFPPHVGEDFAAIDVDNCLIVNGTRRVEEWAKPIIGHSTYAEVSPGGVGARMLVSGISDRLQEMANGHERHNVGIYGKNTSKFVTLTGLILDEAHGVRQVNELSDPCERAVWDYWARMDAERGRPGMDTFAGLYPPGQAGMDMALEDILTGASLHPATVAFVSKAVNRLSLMEIEEALHEAYHASDARDTARWQQRYPKSIEGALEWIKGRDLGPGAKLRNMPTQVVQGGKDAIKSHIAKKDAVMDVPAGSTVEDAAFGYRPIGGGSEYTRFIMPVEYAGIAEMFEDQHWVEGLDDDAIDFARYEYAMEHGKPVPGGLEEMHERATAVLQGQEAIAALRRVPSVEDVPYDLVSSIPSDTIREMAQHIMDRQKMDMPAVAALGALIGVATATQNAFAAEYLQYRTGFNLYGISIAESGAGKDAARDLLKTIAGMVGDGCFGSTVASEAGMYDTLVAAGKSGKVLLWDEVWALFEKVSSDRGSVHDRGMMALMMELSTQAIGSIATTARASRGNQDRPPIIHAPYLNILGTTTEQHLKDAMTTRFLENGLAGRTVFVSAVDAPRKLGRFGVVDISDDLRRRLHEAVQSFRVISMAFADGTLDKSRMMRVASAGPAPDGKVFVRVDISPDRQLRLEQWGEDQREACQRNSPIRTAVSRAAAEQPIRIAGLIAIGKLMDTAQVLDIPVAEALNEYGCVVDDACIDYALQFVGYNLTRLRDMAGDLRRDAISVAEAQIEALHRRLSDALTDPDHASWVNREGMRDALRSGWVTKAYWSRLAGKCPKHVADGVMASLVDGEFLGPLSDLPDHLQKAGKQKAQGWQFLEDFM